MLSSSSLLTKKGLGGTSLLRTSKMRHCRMPPATTATRAVIEIPAVTTNNGPVEQDVAALNKALNEPLAQRPAYDKQKRKEQLISKGFGNRLALTDGPELPIEQRSFWAYLYDALAAEYKGLVAPGTNFQFAADNIVADWHDNTNYNSWLMGDTAPSAAGYYYLPSTNSISQAYKDFLSALEPVGYQQNQDYVTARSTLNNLIQVQISKANESQNAYKNWKSQNPGISDGISYLGWLTSTAFGGNAYNEGLIEAQADYDKQRAFVAKLFTIASQPLVDAITNASAAQFTTNYVPPGGSTAIALPATTIHPDLSTAVSNWDQAPANIYQLDKTFTKDTVYTSPWSEHVQVDVDVRPCSYSEHTTIDYTRIVKDVNFAIRITAVGAQPFTISREGWFDANFLSRDDVKISSLSLFNKDTFFGPKGSLKLIPTQVFVIYKPSVSITISSSTWEESVKDSLTYATDSIWLFGMHFDASKAVTTVNVQNDTHTIKFDNLSGGVAQPLVLGVLSDSYLHVGPPKLHANALLGEAPKRGKLPSGYWPA